MKLKTLAIGLFCLAAALAHADYNPVPLTPSSYTFDIVVESNAPLALPYCLNGTSGGNPQSSNTLYEVGLYARPGQPGGSSGIPLHNTTFTDVNNSNVHFLMPPDYTTNNNLQVDSTHVTGTLAFVTPTTATNLAFLSGGGGAVVVGVTVTHSDASTEVGSISCATAFTPGATPVAWACNGWITIGGTFTVGSLTNVNTYPGGAGPFLYRYNMTVSSATPIVRVTFTYSSGGNEGDFYAISGNASGASWTPIPVTGFNIRSTVPGNFPVTATMDQGTNTQQNANLATWFERGYVPGSPTNGLPPSGSIFNSSSQPTHHYQMANYQSNNAILIDMNHLAATITPASPAPYNAFSLLTAGGNVGVGSKMTNRCILIHADGVRETNIFYGYDWFETTQPSAVAWVASGRVNMANRTINNLGTVNPKLFETFFFLKDTNSPVTNILLQYVTAPNTSATTFIMAVSATAGGVPIIFDTNTIAQNVYSGNSALFNASLAAGTVPEFYWQKSSATNGPWTTLANGPTGTGSVVSGATSSNLVISSVGASDVAYYQCIGTNGVTTTLTTTPPIPLTLLVNTYSNILTPGDSLADFGSTTASPAGETVAEANDGTLNTWFAYGTDFGFEPFIGPVGFVVTPLAGNTVVTGLRVFASENNPLDDPYDIMLEGSNDGGNTWTTIYADAPLGLSDLRNPASGPIVDTNLIEAEVDFPSAGGYFTYRVTFEDVKDNEGANDVAGTLDVGEIELLGYVNPIPPVIVSGPGSANKTLYIGANFSAAITANGPVPITYQWYYNNNPISNATNPAYSIPNVQTVNGGTYYVSAANSYGTTNSSTIDLSVVPIPSYPYVQTVYNDHPIAYWRMDETDIGGGDNGVTATDYIGGHDGTYTNVVLGAPGYSDFDSDTAVAVGEVNLDISEVNNIQGINFAKPTGQDGAFSIEAWVQGYYQSTLYQLTNGEGIVTLGYGGGGEQFCLDCGGISNSFRLYFRDANGNVYNAPALGITTADGIWHHLVGVVDEPNKLEYLWVDGQLASLNALATNGLGILAENAPTNRFTIGWRNGSVSTPLNPGYQYSGTIDEVSIYNYALSSNQVQNHYLAAGIVPRFVLNPTNETVSEDTTATFTSQAYGTATLAYQWYNSDGSNPTTPVSGQTTSNLNLLNVQASQSGNYYVLIVTNAYGAVTSPVVQLTVISGAPQFVTDLQPAYTVFAGTPLILSVQAAGTPPLSYQWQCNATNVLNGGRVSGANSNTLTILSSQAGDSGNYQVLVSDPDGITPSQVGAVTVVPVLTFNGTGQGWTVNLENNAVGNDGFQPAANTLRLTDDMGSEGTSAFFNAPVYVGSFVATFSYQDLTPNTGADGFAFVVQNDPRKATALGAAGGSFGYIGIAPSVGIEYNIYEFGSDDTYSFATSPTVPGPFTSTSPVFIDEGNVVNFTITYVPGTLTVKLVDTSTGSTSTASYAVNIPSALGASTAYVGITGADGGVASTQVITGFQYIPIVSLSGAMNGNNIQFSWPAAIGGYVLEQTSNLNSPNWVPATAPITTVGGINYATVPSSGPGAFYRLHLSY